MLDLYRIRFKDGIKAADSRLVWASSKDSAENLGFAWCEPRGFRFIGADIETVAREGAAPEPVAQVPGVVKPVKDKLPSAAVFAAASSK